MRIRLSARTALGLFIAMTVVVVALAAWWIVFMAQLTDEKVEMAESLGADDEYVEAMHQQEIRRQIMLGMEGVFFLLLFLFGAWLIYRSLVADEERKRQQQNFLMAVTHELKTPLASLNIYLDTLRSAKISPEKKDKALPRMKQDILRLEKLVDDILEAGRLDRQEYRLANEPVSLSELVTECLNDLANRPLDVPLQVNRDLVNGAMITGDRRAIKRAVTAVLDNAAKYHDGKRAELDVALEVGDGRVVLTVTDGGIGFSRRDAEAIFDRFYRVGSEMTRKYAGSGLGLYLCREIVRAHGGDVTAESRGAGMGSTFTLTFVARQKYENSTTG